MPRIIITSPNIIRDKFFRNQLKLSGNPESAPSSNEAFVSIKMALDRPEDGQGHKVKKLDSGILYIEPDGNEAPK